MFFFEGIFSVNVGLHCGQFGLGKPFFKTGRNVFANNPIFYDRFPDNFAANEGRTMDKGSGPRLEHAHRQGRDSARLPRFAMIALAA
jgi:hypothetical protein